MLFCSQSPAPTTGHQWKGARLQLAPPAVMWGHLTALPGVHPYKHSQKSCCSCSPRLDSRSEWWEVNRRNAFKQKKIFQLCIQPSDSFLRTSLLVWKWDLCFMQKSEAPGPSSKLCSVTKGMFRQIDSRHTWVFQLILQAAAQKVTLVQKPRSHTISAMC